MSQAPHLIGRHDEVSSLRRRLDEGAPVVTVWGPPGAGKTRLACAVAPDAPVCTLVTCVSIEDVLRAIAAALGVTATDRAGVARALSRTPRVILDAADPARDALEILVPTWERVRLLVTARAALGIESEESFELGPLAPDDAAELYHSRARALGHAPDETRVAAIVQAVDGLPQALEWLAGRAALLGEAACLARLEARTMTSPLSAALDESLEALDAETGRALEALATFERGAPAALVERVSSLDAVDALTRRSLVRLEHEPSAPTRVRPYRAVVSRVRGRMEEAGTWDGAASLHAEAVLQYVEALPSSTADAHAALRAERAELDAIAARFADREPTIAARALVLIAPLAMSDGTLDRVGRELGRFIDLDDASLASRVRLALARIERRLGRFDEAKKHLAEVSDELLIESLLERAHLDRQQSRSDEALRGYLAALECAGARDDRHAVCTCLGEVGRMLQSLGRLREAREHHMEAIAIATRLGLSPREALERSLHARATHRLGQVREALSLHERALELHRSLDDSRLAAAELGHLGYCHHEAGAFDAAESAYRASIDGLARAGDVALEHIERVLYARLLGDLGRFEEARLELHIARELAEGLDMPRLWLTFHLVEGLVAALSGDRESAREAFASSLGEALLTEVGFEALLPFHMAMVGDVRPSLVEAADSAIDRLDNPGIAAARDLLRAAIRGEAPPDVPETLFATSSDARRAKRLAGGEGAPSLIVTEDGSFFRLRGETNDLSRRTAPRRLLKYLADAHARSPGVPLGRDALIEAGWPGERMRPDAADKRLRTAIWTLRKAGLEGIVVTRDEGYLLHPLARVTRVTAL